MSRAVRQAVLRTLGSQQVSLELAIERGNIALQYFIERRMAALEAAIAGDGNDDVAS